MDARTLFSQLREIVVGNDTDPSTSVIEAIKRLRYETGTTLAEAKYIVDVLRGWHTISPEEWRQRQGGYQPTAKFPLPNPEVAELQKYAKTVKAELDGLEAHVETIRQYALKAKTFSQFKEWLAKI